MPMREKNHDALGSVRLFREAGRISISQTATKIIENYCFADESKKKHHKIKVI